MDNVSFYSVELFMIKSLGVHDVCDLGCLCCWGQKAQGDHVRGVVSNKKQPCGYKVGSRAWPRYLWHEEVPLGNPERRHITS